jgi:hypothetical protein
MIDPQLIETQVSPISVVGKAVEGWESNFAAGVWMRPSQEFSHFTEAEHQSQK